MYDNNCSLVRITPRLRGEHTVAVLGSNTSMGSPPPTRGTPCGDNKQKFSLRITPAYAGNTKVYLLLLYSNQDHPRLRGEHPTFIWSFDILLGSPPPTRGTQWLQQKNCRQVGITPAYAGNTKYMLLRNFLTEDHPRLRGEHEVTKSDLLSREGSPPPTRGTHALLYHQRTYFGITPAYAGNTC